MKSTRRLWFFYMASSTSKRYYSLSKVYPTNIVNFQLHGKDDGIFTALRNESSKKGWIVSEISSQHVPRGSLPSHISAMLDNRWIPALPWGVDGSSREYTIEIRSCRSGSGRASFAKNQLQTRCSNAQRSGYRNARWKRKFRANNDNNDIIIIIMNKNNWKYMYILMEFMKFFQEETEWQHFLRCNIECLAKVADISPVPIFTLMYRSWREDLTVYGELGAAVTNGQVILLNDNEAANVHAHLRDLASTTQALARLYTLFIGKCKRFFLILSQLSLRWSFICRY